MAFSQSTITGTTIARDGADLLISWTTTSPAGTWFQGYLGGNLAFSTTRTYAHVPVPNDLVQVEVGTVGGYSERLTDFASSLPAPALTRATLTWQGGTYLDASGNDDVAGFRVYGSAVAGGSVDYTTVLGDIPAYAGGIIVDGYGLGGYGLGGYGKSASNYSWISKRLGAGVWRFGIAPYDKAGNPQGTPSEVSVTIAAPPRTPGQFSDGTRLKGSYNNTAHTITLSWNSSPL